MRNKGEEDKDQPGLSGSCYFTFSRLALIATTTVLRLMRTAPAAGLNDMPCLYRMRLTMSLGLLLTRTMPAVAAATSLPLPTAIP